MKAVEVEACADEGCPLSKRQLKNDPFKHALRISSWGWSHNYLSMF